MVRETWATRLPDWVQLSVTATTVNGSTVYPEVIRLADVVVDPMVGAMTSATVKSTEIVAPYWVPSVDRRYTVVVPMSEQP